jgi:hypothetical protein
MNEHILVLLLLLVEKVLNMICFTPLLEDAIYDIIEEEK